VRGACAGGRVRRLSRTCGFNNVPEGYLRVRTLWNLFPQPRHDPQKHGLGFRRERREGSPVAGALFPSFEKHPKRASRGPQTSGQSGRSHVPLYSRLKSGVLPVYTQGENRTY